MIRVVLLLVLFILIARMFWRVVDNIVEAASGRPPRAPEPRPGVPMVRDPVCGTFVLPERSVSIVEEGGRVHFCSKACRDAYRSRQGSRGRRAGGRV
jgi:YHS domain-containing protein